MKIVLSTLMLVVVILSLAPLKGNAFEITQEESMSSGSSSTKSSSDITADDLFALRALLLLDPNATQDQFEEIDNQLLKLGVEKISGAEVAQKLGETAQPLFDIESTDDTTWYSERSIVVIRGWQYETQVITGQWNNRNSDLCKTISGVKKQYYGEAVGTINALQVIANEVVTGSITDKIPIVGDVLSYATTLYDILSAYDEGMSPTSVLDNAEYSFDILMGATARLVFVKNAGSPDVGYQILGYAGTLVNYSVYVDIPIFTKSNGEQTMTRETQVYHDYAKSYSFDEVDCKYFAAENRRLYSEGYTSLDTQHEIRKIPIILLNEEYIANAPCRLPI